MGRLQGKDRGTRSQKGHQVLHTKLERADASIQPGQYGLVRLPSRHRGSASPSRTPDASQRRVHISRAPLGFYHRSLFLSTSERRTLFLDVSFLRRVRVLTLFLSWDGLISLHLVPQGRYGVLILVFLPRPVSSCPCAWSRPSIPFLLLRTDVPTFPEGERVFVAGRCWGTGPTHGEGEEIGR